MDKQNFVHVDTNYLKELEETAKKVDYYKGIIDGINMVIDRKDEPQTDCYVSDLCKHYGDKQICGRCRSRNLFCEAEPQPQTERSE